MKQMLLAIKQMNSTQEITNAMEGNLIKKVGTDGNEKKKYWKQTSVANKTKWNRH